MRSAAAWQLLSIVCPLLVLLALATAGGPRAEVVPAPFEGEDHGDQIVQSDRRQGMEPASRTIALTQRYLHLPVQNGAPIRKVTIHCNGVSARAFDIKLAEGNPDFWVFDDLQALEGKTLEIA